MKTAHSRAEVMKSADDIIIAPVALMLYGELTVKVKNKQMLFIDSRCNLLSYRPSLHDPDIVFIKRIIKIGNRLTDGV